MKIKRFCSCAILAVTISLFQPMAYTEDFNAEKVVTDIRNARLDRLGIANHFDGITSYQLLSLIHHPNNSISMTAKSRVYNSILEKACLANENGELSDDKYEKLTNLYTSEMLGFIEAKMKFNFTLLRDELEMQFDLKENLLQSKDNKNNSDNVMLTQLTIQKGICTVSHNKSIIPSYDTINECIIIKKNDTDDVSVIKINLNFSASYIDIDVKNNRTLVTMCCRSVVDIKCFNENKLHWKIDNFQYSAGNTSGVAFPKLIVEDLNESEIIIQGGGSGCSLFVLKLNVIDGSIIEQVIL